MNASSGPTNGRIHFVKEGGVVPKSAMDKNISSILDGADDWVLLDDLGKQLKFPYIICSTSLRPDIVIFSKKLKKVIIVELTSPCEENFEFWHLEKLTKYSELADACKAAGWTVVLFAVEVGARGFASSSLKECYHRFGIVGRQARVALDQAATNAVRASFWIWLKRKEKPGEEPVTKGEHSAKFASIQKNRKRKAPVENVQGIGKKRRKEQEQRSRKEKKPEQRTAPKVRKAPKIHFTVNRAVPVFLPRGIKNLGNTCFVNSSLQALSTFQEQLVIPLESHLSVALGQALLDLRNANNSPLYPILFIQEVRRLVGAFPVNTFQDAHEFIIRLLGEVNCQSLQFQCSSTVSCSTCQESSSTPEESMGIQVAIDPNATRNILSRILAQR